jgi:hypothetical protein
MVTRAHPIPPTTGPSPALENLTNEKAVDGFHGLAERYQD